MGSYLEDSGIAPDLVLCSSSARTRETLERLRLADDVPVVFEEGLYAASASSLLARLREVEDDVESVLLIGHNPGMQDLALDLASSGDELDAVERKFPTAALATLEFEGAWSELAPGGALLAAFVKPKQLG